MKRSLTALIDFAGRVIFLMWCLALLLAIATLGRAQGATLTLSGPATVLRNQTATLSLTLSGSSGMNLSAVQWTYGSLPAGVTLTATIATASTAAGKGLVCGIPGFPCEVIGRLPVTNALSDNPMVDSVVATVQMTASATAPIGAFNISLTGLVAIDTSGKAQPLTAGANYTGKVVLSNCDVNGDGQVDFNDVAPIADATVGRIPCTFAPGCNLGNVVAMILAAMPPSPTNPLAGVCPF